MKTSLFRTKLTLAFFAAATVAIIAGNPVFSQESAGKKFQKKMVVKIVKDDNGKTTIYDTTMDLPDSASTDAVKSEMRKVMIMKNGGKHPCIIYRNAPEGFSSNFDMPCPPGCMEEMEGMELEGMAPGMEADDFILDGGAPPHGRGMMMRSGGSGQTLNDLLGEIPMERVVSYSIKDRKNGKRIIIDLNDAPMFEKQDRIVVIREPGRMQQRRNHGERQVKVIVNTDDGPKVEAVQEETVPPPPPPPPPPPADKKSPKK